MFNQARVRAVGQAIGAGASGNIPIAACGWSFTLLSGTGTFNGVPVSAGFSDSDANTLAGPIPYTTGAASSAYLRINVGVPA